LDCVDKKGLLMPSATTMAATFYTPAPDTFIPDFIAQHTRPTPWKRQSVAVLVFAPEHDKVALCLPRKVLAREREDRIRVPLQGRLTGRSVNPIEAARQLLKGKADLLVRADAITYLGFGFTRSFRTADVSHSYNKLLHFVRCALPDARRLPPETEYAAHLDWFHLDALPGIAASSMDERKAWLFFEALKVVAAAHTPYAPRLRSAVGVSGR
jgi:hypothetical protein